MTASRWRIKFISVIVRSARFAASLGCHFQLLANAVTPKGRVQEWARPNGQHANSATQLLRRIGFGHRIRLG